MPVYSNVFAQMLVQFVVLSFFVFGVIGMALGAGLVFSSARMHRLFDSMNRWFSTRTALKPLEVPRQGFGQVVLKYRRWFGLVLVVGGGFAAYGLAAKVNATAAGATLSTGRMLPLVQLAIESLKWFLVLGSVIGVLIGVMLLFFPNALGNLEKYSNRWVSSRRLVRGGDEMHVSLDNLVEAYPRASGWLIGCASLGVAIYSGILLFGRL